MLEGLSWCVYSSCVECTGHVECRVAKECVQWTASRQAARLPCRTVPSELCCVYRIWHSDGGVAEDSAYIAGRGVAAISKDRDTFTFVVKQSK